MSFKITKGQVIKGIEKLGVQFMNVANITLFMGQKVFVDLTQKVLFDFLAKCIKAAEH